MSNSPAIPVVSKHRCARRHVSAVGFARCVWPGVVTITGTGRYAVLTCKPLSISLWPLPGQAGEFAVKLDVTGCGRHCSHSHQLVVLDHDVAQ